jgi:hypothetical protein
MRPARTAVALFAGALALYLANLSLVPLATDSIPNAYLPSSLLGDADLAFSPFEAPGMFLWKLQSPSGETAAADVQFWSQMPAGESRTYADLYAERRLEFDGWKYYIVPTVRSRDATGEPLFVGAFGPFPGLMALPVVALAQLSGARLWDQVPMVASAKLTAAALVAGSVALVYLTALGFLPGRRAALLAAAYGAGTCVWAVSSQALWQQTAELFFLALGAFFLVRVPTPTWRGALAGLAFSMAAACRPTAVLVALLVAAWLAFSDRRAFVAFAVAALPLAVAVAAYNQYYFGSPLDFGQLTAGARIAQYKTGSPELWQTPLWVGAAGLLASPSRGLFVFSPFLLMAVAGSVLAWRDARYRPLRVLTLAVPVLWLPAFAWFDWWGGWTFGYRPIVDSVPLLAVLCIPALACILERPLWRAGLAVALAWSVFVQALGAFAYSPWGWDARAVDAAGSERASIDLPEYRHRLWSFSDWQIGYLITHFAEARAERARPAVY